MKYSVVFPVYNEEGAVANLHEEIKNVMERIGEPYEIIVTDDGSTDGTFEVLRTLRPIKVVRFRTNFGQTSGLDAGIKQATGEMIITMDGDGQDDPNEIPKLIAKINEGYDVVAAWRYRRQDNLKKRILTRLADKYRQMWISDGIHDSGCQFRIYRRECFDDFDLFGEMHRFIAGVLKWRGFTIAEVKVNHRQRTTGHTKYNWKRIIKGSIDVIGVWYWRKYAGRPLHLFGGLGLVIGGLGFILGVYLAIARFLNYLSLQASIWPLISVLMILVGVQLFVSGVIADILVKSYYNGKRMVYHVKEIYINE